MIITLAGKPGTGKSKIGEILSRDLNLKFVSTGGMFREKAKELGMSMLDLHEHAKIDESIDMEIDEYIKTVNDTVIDSKIARFFRKDAKKILLICEDEVRVERCFERNDSESMFDLIEREKVEKKRFLEKYGFDLDSWKNIDIIYDTTYKTAEQAAKDLMRMIS